MIQTFIKQTTHITRLHKTWPSICLPTEKPWNKRTSSFSYQTRKSTSGGDCKKAIRRDFGSNSRLPIKRRSSHYSAESARSCSSLAPIANISATIMTKPTDEYRLPLDVKPTHYDVTIRTDLETQTFTGFVKIKYVGTF